MSRRRPLLRRMRPDRRWRLLLVLLGALLCGALAWQVTPSISSYFVNKRKTLWEFCFEWFIVNHSEE